MKLNLPEPEKYVVAVSGGVDSICLLDILSSYSGYDLVVAHFDHGIRPDSAEDFEFVSSLAVKYGYTFVGGRGKLGPNASEANARAARYKFLVHSKDQHGAIAIITAHHQDDRLETLFINLMRGTGRTGLASIRESAKIKRPLLQVSKAELYDHALKYKLSWREDATNSETRYLRNHIRQSIIPKLSAAQRQYLIELMDKQELANSELDNVLAEIIDQSEKRKLSRQSFSQLQFSESKELLAAWLRSNNLLNFDRKTLERLTVAATTKKPGTRVNVYGGVRVTVNKEVLALEGRER